MMLVISFSREARMVEPRTSDVCHADKRSRTRARILETAARAFREHGVDGLGVAGLMARAGLTSGGFYNHFSSRDDLVSHAVDRMFEDSVSIRRRHLGRADPRSNLGSLVDDYLSDDRLGDAACGCPMPSLGGEARRMPEDARERFGSGVIAFRNALVREIHALGLERPGETASSTLSEMVGAMALARACPSTAVGKAILDASRRQIKRRLGLDPDAPQFPAPEGETR